ncbi:hypothetical protein CEE36_04650 [candidate division TA06 bacterium B3_TA06]|uniref:Uncharacterized protein n=1 Tax=candidate division TA06 bacterium B3_TA06 TaxID=2012487 RepID=A0A532V807_UNCT6|nr:MAG: hypothetical protein CEE36_04650 [candidate division TA06 bacterium B3_TA06]
MAKPKERKPQPNPKEWKWCKHPECMKQAQQLEGFGGVNEQELMREYSELCAIFLEDYCWGHLSNKAEYRVKIQKSIQEGHLLIGRRNDAVVALQSYSLGLFPPSLVEGDKGGGDA